MWSHDGCVFVLLPWTRQCQEKFNRILYARGYTILVRGFVRQGVSKTVSQMKPPSSFLPWIFLASSAAHCIDHDDIPWERSSTKLPKTFLPGLVYQPRAGPAQCVRVFHRVCSLQLLCSALARQRANQRQETHIYRQWDT